MDAASMQVIRAERGVARREVDLHLLGAAAAWGWSSGEQRCSVRVRAGGARDRRTRCARIVRIYEEVWAQNCERWAL